MSLPPPNPADSGTSPAAVAHDGPFTILKVRFQNAEPSEFFPGPGPETNSILPESEDGLNVLSATATKLQVASVVGGTSPKVILEIDNVQATVVVTDSRVAVACTNYLKARKSRPYTLGALPVTMAINAVNKARVNKRQAGNVMVGQVRYPWLTFVGFKEFSGWRGRINVLRLVITNPQREGIAPNLLLDISVPNGPTGAMAHDIVRRASSYRLSREDGQLSDKTRRRLTELLNDPSLPAKSEGFVLYDFNAAPRPLES